MFGFYAESWREHTTSGAGLALQTWHHVAAVFDDASDNVSIYVDGELLFSAAEGSSMVINAFPLRIGASGFPNENFSGRIDRIRIYDRALTSTEVETLFFEADLVEDQRNAVRHWARYE